MERAGALDGSAGERPRQHRPALIQYDNAGCSKKRLTADGDGVGPERLRITRWQTFLH